MPQYTSADGLRLAYRDQGEGRPLICLAGLTRDARDFDYLAPHLTGLRLIRPDYRGRGGSDWAADPATYTIPSEAQDILALLDHLSLDSAAILGTSRGGLIAMTMAAIARPRVQAVCLNDIGPEIAAEGLDRIRHYVGVQPRFATQEQMAAAMPAGMPHFANVPASRWLQEVRHHTTQTTEGLRLTYDPALATVFNATSAQPAPDLWPLFDALSDLPLALIRGANSDLLSAATAAEMCRRRPDMIFADVPDRGHVPFLDEPEALDVIRRWLKAIP